MNINSDLADSQQPINISSQILQSPNVYPSSSMDLSNELITNERVGGLQEKWRSELLSGLHPTTFSTPSIKHRFSFTDSHWYPIQSCALAHWSLWVALTTLTNRQVLLMKSLHIMVRHTMCEIFVYNLCNSAANYTWLDGAQICISKE